MYKYWIEKLKGSLKYIKTNSSNNAIFRCPFCGDSSKSPHKGHFYISIDKGLYNCFRCNEKGHISKLIKYFLQDNYIEFIKEYKNNKIENIKEIYLPFSKELKLKLDSKYFEYGENSNIELLQWINERTNFFNDTKRFYDFLKLNFKQRLFILSNTKEFIQEIIYEKFSKDLNKLKYLEKKISYNYDKLFIYFSLFKNSIYIRKIRDRIFTNFKIDYNQKDYPVIFLNDKIFLKRIINIIVVEGIFDAINLVINRKILNSLKTEIDMIVISNGKKSLTSAVKFIERTFLVNYNIYYLLDKDVSDDIENVKYILFSTKKILTLNEQTFFIKNKLSKDYGDISEGIELEML